jgi:hypothetical protein
MAEIGRNDGNKNDSLFSQKLFFEVKGINIHAPSHYASSSKIPEL